MPVQRFDKTVRSRVGACLLQGLDDDLHWIEAQDIVETFFLQDVFRGIFLGDIEHLPYPRNICFSEHGEAEDRHVILGRGSAMLNNLALGTWAECSDYRGFQSLALCFAKEAGDVGDR